MTDTVNTIERTASVIELSFSWSPSYTYTFTAPDLTVLAAPGALTKTVVTFTASSRIANNGNDISGPLTITEYLWDFGDGVLGYGNPVTHTYVLANFQAQATLRITDSKGRFWFGRQQIYLAAPAPSPPGVTVSLPLLLNRMAPPAGTTTSLPLLFGREVH